MKLELYDKVSQMKLKQLTLGLSVYRNCGVLLLCSSGRRQRFLTGVWGNFLCKKESNYCCHEYWDHSIV